MVVTPEDTPWWATLEEGTFNGKATIRDRTVADPPGTTGLEGRLFGSTEGMQVTTHCAFRGAQPAVKQEAEAVCGHAFPATSTATIYNPSTRTDEAVEADGFELLVIEEETACSGSGQATEEAEVHREPSRPGHPALYDVPGVAVAPCNGEVAPHLKNGTSAKAPSELIYDQNGNNGGKSENDTSGTLACEGVGPGNHR